MHTYIFVLGRNPDLSLAELRARFGSECEEVFICREAAVLSFKKVFEEPQRVLNTLGGTIKICEVFTKITDVDSAQQEIADYLVSSHKEKVIFALSAFNIQKTFKINLKFLLINIKKLVRKEVTGKVRFLNKPDQNISSVVVSEEKMIRKGTDINIVKTDAELYIGRTIAVQDFKNYSLRDYERPARDAKSGMLPPKLAQIMLNLACKSENDCKVYDPFCGSGTILMEGLLMGHEVMGSDISEKAIADTQDNLDWFCEAFKQEEVNIKGVFVKDAREISKEDFTIMPNCIVGETYLGPPLFKVPEENEVRENFKEIEGIVLGFLEKALEVFPNGVKIVLAVPFYKGRKKKYFIDGLRGKITEMGFSFEKDGNLLYSRSNQTVGRQILSFKK